MPSPAALKDDVAPVLGRSGRLRLEERMEESRETKNKHRRNSGVLYFSKIQIDCLYDGEISLNLTQVLINVYEANYDFQLKGFSK